MSRNAKLRRIVSALLLLQFTCQTFIPTHSWALTSGPSQPEFSSFEPVATTNMVDEFSGDFTYNLPVIEVPGPHGSSYPLSLSYHSGVTPEEEASWVGYGWTLNPGAINRGTRGFPDDFNGEQIKFHNKMPKNWTATVGGGAQFGEIFGIDLALGVNASIRYNNYRGFGYNAGAGLTLGRGIVSLGYHVDNAEGSFSLNVNPAAILNYNYKEEIDVKTVDRKRSEQKFNKLSEKSRAWSHKASVGRSTNLFGSTYGMFSYTETSKPNIVQRYEGKSFNVSIGLEGNVFPVPIGGTVNVWGSYTHQQNVPEESVPAYGYMYSANATSSGVMDYHVEKETDFNKRDVFLGIPFNDADNFMVTGEGLSGGFRMYNNAAGHFGPRNMKSDFNIFNVGGEIGAGWTFGPGVDVGIGSNEFEVSDWKRETSLFSAYGAADTDEPVVFRFNNDLGGEWGGNHHDMPLQARVSGKDFNLPADVFSANNSERTGRSSYIGFHTNNEFAAQAYRCYTKTTAINAQAQRSSYGNLIGELAVINESGSRYLYGLPVYNRNEKSLSFAITSGATIDRNYLAYNVNTVSSKVKIGQEQNASYASTYLLTEITGPDYLDRSNNGPTEDDFGGYTRFNYEKARSPSNDEWYNWRIPYRGLLYNKNSHSDPQDDQGSYSEGEKQIYYLYSIETKTHVAFFITGSRNDSREAPSGNGMSPEASPGDFNLKRLNRIELYSLEDCEKSGELLTRSPETGSPVLLPGVKPLKTVHFNYDYHLSAGVPNSTASGKLTLTSIYFEYNGINRTMISPYRFEYQYPDYTQYPGKYRTGGNDDVTENFIGLSPTMQNPPYSEFNIDAWGHYQDDGQARFNNMEPWLDQQKVANVHFDPAAWHLKVVRLPSGGEIHVQYEQDEYSFVQDQEAHVMIRLAEQTGDGGGKRFFIDPASVGVMGTDVQAMRDMIHRRYVNKDQKIYFKFLYRLLGPAVAPNLESCNAEFITGYASIEACEMSGNFIYLDFKYDSQTPLKVCKDFVRTHRLGKLDINGNCDPSLGMSDSNKPESVVRQLFGMISGTLLPDQLCQAISFNHSFLRVPTPLPKKGGGVRVKRLMMFSNGLEGEPVLYGNEYLYETYENGRRISSGVATNEPQVIREENILVNFVARKGQDLWSRIVAGRDKKQSEGPIGESVLPGPSVGYSKVIVKNIHSGQSAPGYSVSEYFTARDYPVKLASPGEPGSMTPINSPRPDKDFVYGALINVIKDKTRASQGFSFVVNNMHGQVKQASSFAGEYVPGTDGQRVAYTMYEYFEPGEKVPMMAGLYEGVEYKNPGREVDITFAQRQVTESSYDANLEGDLQITIIPLAFVVLVIPYPTAVPSFSFIEGELSTHATSKVVRYPAIVKKVEAYQDGIVHTEENLAFDRWTGKPVAVKSYDEFKGAYLAQNIPASWEYKEMTAKWTSEGKRIVGVFSFDGTYVSLGDGCNLAEFTTGDKVELGAGTQALYHVEELDWSHSRVKVVRLSAGNTAPASPSVITIIHSGKTNQLQHQTGNITYFSDQHESLSIPVVSQLDRYETKDVNSFLEDLTNATSTLTGSGNFELTGTYHQMDMSAFGDRVPECANDLRNATVRQLEYRYIVIDDGISIQLMSFNINCGDISGPWITVASEGWE